MSRTVTTEGALDVIRTIDGMSQDAFERIRAIARLTLLAMETKAGCNSLDDIGFALEAIRSLAVDTMSCINYEAENVGANFKDEAWHRRLDAMHSARQQGGAA